MKSITVADGGDFASRAVEAGAFDRGLELDFTRAGKPDENGSVESFSGRLRDDCLNVHQFLSLDDAKAIFEARRSDCDAHRPHTSLGDLTPTGFASRLQAAVTPAER